MSFTSEEARMYALERHPCPYCGRPLRPCNRNRHISAAHFRQLTIYDMEGMHEPARTPRRGVVLRPGRMSRGA